MKDRGPSRKKESGSLKKSEPEFLVIGKLRKSHGLKGEMWIEVLTDNLEVFNKGNYAFIGEQHTRVSIRSFRLADKLGLIRFVEYETPESVGHFRNLFLYFEFKNMPDLPENEYYHHELIGMEVINPEGMVIGSLVEILTTGANDVYVINQKNEAGEILIPAIESVILKIDIKSKIMTIKLPEWES